MLTVDKIRNLMIFAGLGDEELSTIAEQLELETFDKDDLVFNEGDTGDKFYIVDEGMVSISLDIEGIGSEELIYLERPAVFGEMALIDAAPRSASAICRKPTKLLSLNKSSFEKLLEENTDLGNKMMISLIRIFCSRIRKSNDKLRNYFLINRAWG